MNTADKAVRQAVIRDILKNYKAVVDFPSSIMIDDMVELYPDAKVSRSNVSLPLRAGICRMLRASFSVGYPRPPQQPRGLAQIFQQDTGSHRDAMVGSVHVSVPLHPLSPL